MVVAVQDFFGFFLKGSVFAEQGQSDYYYYIKYQFGN